jgi:peroxiredoxin
MHKFQFALDGSTARGAFEYLDGGGAARACSTATITAACCAPGRGRVRLAIVAVFAACAPKPPLADPGELRAEAVAAQLVGTPAPALTVTTLDGQTIDLATLYGTKPVYLKFWATWCVPCREQMPRFERLFETLGDRVAVIAVDAGLDDDPAAVRAFREARGLRMPIVVDDGRLAAALDLQVTPQHVVIDREARVAFVGHRDGAKLDRALDRAIAEPASTALAPRRPALRPALHPGDIATDLIVHADDGRTTPLGATPERRAHAVVLFATWCEDYLAERQPTSSRTCKRVREEVDALRAERHDIDWVGVANGLWTSPADITEYRTKTRTQLPIALDTDGALFRAFDVHALGTVVLIDGDGKVVRIIRPGDDLRGGLAALRGDRL